MAWPKGVPRPKKVKTLEIVGVEEPAIEQDETVFPAETDVQVLNAGDIVSTQDTWRYHDTLEPRVFKAGEVIPADWTSDHSKWRRNQMGQWEKAA